MRASRAIWGVWAILGACAADGSSDGDAAQDVAQGDGDSGPGEPSKVTELTASIVAPWRDEPGTFNANVAQECRFLASGQLHVTGTALSATTSESLAIRIGIFETVDLSTGPQSFDIVSQPDKGSNVTLGKAALTFGFEDKSGATINLSHILDGSKVTVSSLDPCEGTFNASIAALDPNGAAITIELTDGAFAITRTVPP